MRRRRGWAVYVCVCVCVCVDGVRLLDAKQIIIIIIIMSTDIF